MRVGCIVAVMGAALFCAVAGAADWPHFRGPASNGIAPDTGINKHWAAKAPAKLWRLKLSDQGHGGPAVAGGKVFFIDHVGGDDIVRAVSLADGKDLWQHRYPDATLANYGFTRSTPAVDGDRVYTVSRQGKVHCLKAATGQVVWALDLVKDLGCKRPGWDYASSPLIDGERLILVPGGDKSVAAVNKLTGKIIWQGGAADAAAGYSTPVVATIAKQKQYVVFTGTQLSGVAADDGKVLWSFPWKTAHDVNAATPVVIGESVFISSGYNTGCALVDVSATGAVQRWRNKSVREHLSSAVTDGEYIYSTDDAGAVVCLEVKTGAEKWRGGPKTIEKGGLIAVDGVLLVLSGKNGELLMVEMSPKGYKELGRLTPLGGQSWVTPVLAGGNLLVRNNDAMVCLNLK
jgi:outer membrane protein assembly factor BamB